MDVNLLAFHLVEEATREILPNKAKRAASRKGGLIGGRARAKSISAARRADIARKANEARWKKTTLVQPDQIG